jgi:hypothetical protein
MNNPGENNQCPEARLTERSVVPDSTCRVCSLLSVGTPLNYDAISDGLFVRNHGDTCTNHMVNHKLALESVSYLHGLLALLTAYLTTTFSNIKCRAQ